MELQDKEEEYKQSIWEIYRREWATANSEKRIQLNKRMLHWQELMKNGWTASQAYYKAMQEESDESPQLIPAERKPKTKTRRYLLLALALVLAVALLLPILAVFQTSTLVFNLSSFDFTTQEGETDVLTSTLYISSSRGGTLPWYVSSDAPWLTISPTWGSVTESETAEVTVSVKSHIKSLLDTYTMPVGNYTATITISESKTSDYAQTIPVRFTIIKNERYIYIDDTIAVGGDKEPIELRNNPDATNPTYAELVAFIKRDASDSKGYWEGLEFHGKIIMAHICADFAEDVHNNSEAEGIRAAWVGIDLRGSDEGHALNAFETTDRGLVYVDCTGGNVGGFQLVRQSTSGDALSSKPASWDTIAYVEVGKEYGLIDITKARAPSYSFYDEYKQKWQECEKLLRDYNVEVMQYNQEIQGKVYYEGSSELATIEAWEARLKDKSRLIDELAEELSDFWLEPLGIVEDIYIRW